MHKIRVIQYGVGPIGAGMVRLMAQKPELKIIGAIDIDPTKQVRTSARSPASVAISESLSATMQRLYSNSTPTSSCTQRPLT